MAAVSEFEVGLEALSCTHSLAGVRVMAILGAYFCRWVVGGAWLLEGWLWWS